MARLLLLLVLSSVVSVSALASARADCGPFPAFPPPRPTPVAVVERCGFSEGTESCNEWFLLPGGPTFIVGHCLDRNPANPSASASGPVGLSCDTSPPHLCRLT